MTMTDKDKPAPSKCIPGGVHVPARLDIRSTHQNCIKCGVIMPKTNGGQRG